MVFLGPGATVLNEPEQVKPMVDERSKAGQRTPAFVLVDGFGALVRADLPEGAEPMLACLGLVLARLPEGARVRYLSEEEEAALLGWEAEHYRSRLSRG